MENQLQNSHEIKKLRRMKGYLGVLGPGIVWFALAQGSGELIWWPSIVAKYGLFFIIFLIPACLLQLPINYQLGRYTLITGESFFAGMIRINKIFSFITWIMFFICFIWFGSYASAGGTALAELTKFPKNWTEKGQSLFWAYITIVIFFLMIMFTRKTYSLIEKIMWFVAAVTFIGLTISVINSEVLKSLPVFIKSLYSLERKLPREWNPADIKMLISALLFAGLGGFWNLFYSIWIANKGMGMSSYNEKLSYENQKLYMIDNSEDSKKNYKPWTRALLIDSSVGVVGNLITTLMLCLLAYTYLFPQGLVPSGWKIAVVQSVFFEKAMGPIGKIFFLIIATLFLADTWLATVDAVSKTHTEFLKKFFKKVKLSSNNLYYLWVLALTIITGITMLLAPPGILILITGVLNAGAMIVVLLAIIGLNFIKINKLLPSWARSTIASKIFIILCFFAYITLFIVYLTQVL